MLFFGGAVFEKVCCSASCFASFFAISVPSFAVDISGSVAVTNWPSYFTGSFDGAISATLDNIYSEIDREFTNVIAQLNNDTNLLIAETSIIQDQLTHLVTMIDMPISTFYNRFEYFIAQNLDWLETIDRSLEETINTTLDDGFGYVVGAVSGTTSAVNFFRGTFSDFWEMDWSYQMKQSYSPDTIAYRLRMLQEVLADEKDLEMKKAAESSTDGVFENFVKGSGSVNGSDIGSVLTLSSWFQGFFGGDSGTHAGSYIGTGVSNLQNTLSDTSDSSPFAWFTQSNANAMDTVVSSFSRDVNPATNPVIVTHYYDDKLSEFDIVKEMFDLG